MDEKDNEITMDSILYISSKDNRVILEKYMAEKGLKCKIVVWNETDEVCKSYISFIKEIFDVDERPNILPTLYYLGKGDEVTKEKYEGIGEIEKFLEEYTEKRAS